MTAQGLQTFCFRHSKQTRIICFSDINSRTNYCVLAVNGSADLHFGAAVDGYQQLPRFRYLTEISKTTSPIGRSGGSARIMAQPNRRSLRTRSSITSTLSCATPSTANDTRRTSSANFRASRSIRLLAVGGMGEELMALHIGYQTVEPWPLKRTDVKDERSARAGLTPKAMLKADKDHEIIILDGETQLSGVPRSRGSMGSAITPAWNRFSTSTRRGRRRARPSAQSSTHIASQTTRRR